MPPLPKPAAQRQRRNRTTSATTINAEPAAKIDLRTWLGRGLHKLTLRTWDVWWASPLTQEWVDADVPDLVAIASLVDLFWKTGDPKIHTEIRLAAKEFGLTPMSRRSLQWEIRRLEGTKPKAPEAPRRRRSGKATLSVLTGRASA